MLTANGCSDLRRRDEDEGTNSAELKTEMQLRNKIAVSKRDERMEVAHAQNNESLPRLSIASLSCPAS